MSIFKKIREIKTNKKKFNFPKLEKKKILNLLKNFKIKFNDLKKYILKIKIKGFIEDFNIFKEERKKIYLLNKLFPELIFPYIINISDPFFKNMIIKYWVVNYEIK